MTVLIPLKIGKPLLAGLIAAGCLGLGAMAQAQKSPAEAQGLSPEEQIVISAYKQAGPGVVHITSTALAYDFFFNPVPQRGTGSGFIVDDRGYILPTTMWSRRPIASK